MSENYPLRFFDAEDGIPFGVLMSALKKSFKTSERMYWNQALNMEDYIANAVQVCEWSFEKFSNNGAIEDAAARVSSVFWLMNPADPLNKYGKTIYRSHCSEIASRAVLREDLRPATAAEVLVIMLENARRGLLSRMATRALLMIFFKIFPDNDREILEIAEEREEDPDLEEALDQIRSMFPYMQTWRGF